MKICNQATILLVHLLSSPFVTDDLAVLPPLPPCHNWVGCVVGSPSARHKKSTQVKHVTKICHILAQHSSTRQSCPSPDIQWPPPLYLIRTLPKGEGCCWKNRAPCFTNLVADPVDGFVQRVPIWIEISSKVGISPLFLKDFLTSLHLLGARSHSPLEQRAR